MLIIKNIYQSIYQEIQTEYAQLSLWYFVSFLFGCAYFFSIVQIFDMKYCALVLTILILALYKFHSSLLYRFIIIVLIFFSLGLTAGFFKQLRNTNIKLNYNFVGTLQGSVEQITKLNTNTKIILSEIIILKHNLANTSHQPLLNGKISIKIKDKYFKKLEIGDSIRIKASIMPSPAKIIPGGYDFNFYANFNNISAIGFGLSEPEVIKRNSNWWQNIQKKVYEKLVSSLDSVAANFISALIIGNSQGLDKDTMQNMRFAGISHILCISGLHLSLVTLIFFKFFRFLLNISNYLAHNINIKVVAGIISVICSYGYLKLSGSQVSATRAFIMCALASSAIVLQRDYNPIKSVAIASFCILIFNPEYSMHPSFQLSFLAVLSLITGYNAYIKNTNSAKTLFGKIKADILGNFYSSMFVGITTGPIVIYHFHIFSNYSALANIIAIPITTFVLLPSAFIWLFLSIFDADFYLLKLMSYFVNIIVQSAAFVSNLKYNLIYAGHITSISLSIYVIGFFWFIIWQSKIKYAGIIIIAISIFMMIAQQKPDIILDIKKIAIGLQNQDGQLHIYSDQKFSQFAKQYWSLWFGQKQVISEQFDTKTNHRIVTREQKKVDLIFQDLDCNSDADVIINYSNQYCLAKDTIINIRNMDKNFLFLWCDAKNCKIESFN